MIYERSLFSFKTGVICYSLTVWCCYLHALTEKCIDPNILSRALGALRMRILKVMTLSMMHKDHSLELSPRSCTLRLLVAQSVRLKSCISAGRSAFRHGASFPAESLQRMQPPTGATVRTDGRKKAALARTVTGHRRRTRKTNTPASLLITAGCAVKSRVFIETRVVFRRHHENKTVEPRCCSSFPELGQAAILLRNKGNSKHTEYPPGHSTQTTDDSSYLLINRSLHSPSIRSATV